MSLNIQKTLTINDCAHTPMCTHVHTGAHTLFLPLMSILIPDTVIYFYEATECWSKDIQRTYTDLLPEVTRWPRPTVTFASVVTVFFENVSILPSTASFSCVVKRQWRRQPLCVPCKSSADGRHRSSELPQGRTKRPCTQYQCFTLCMGLPMQMSLGLFHSQGLWGLCSWDKGGS